MLNNFPHLFPQLFLLNCESEFAAILEDVPGGSHGVQYASLYDGCTNISMTTDSNEVKLYILISRTYSYLTLHIYLM